MTPAELAVGLRSAARRSEDAALVAQAGADLHRPEYREALDTQRSCSGPTPQAIADEVAAAHERALELYEHVVVGDRRARELRDEAELFREAALYIDARPL